MGIPRFAYRMADYAHTRVIGSQDAQSRSGQSPIAAFIDGPSLAYFVFSHVKPGARDDLGVNAILGPEPDYAELGRAVITWLDNLESYGFEIKGVYFDGALPDHKQETRLERLQASARKLVNFKRIYDEVEKEQRSSKRHTSSEYNTRTKEVARKQLPAPPFLVFSVVEALHHSPYADKTWVVPGEADTFCVAAVTNTSLGDDQSQLTVFTNDSDLLIYEHRSKTKVVMIDSIVELDCDDSKVLQAREFWPWELCRTGSTHLTSLIEPAFEMLDTYVSFVEALKRSRRVMGSAEYEKFEASYSIDDARNQLNYLQNLRDRGQEGGLMDSRISEFFHLALRKANYIEHAGSLPPSAREESRPRSLGILQLSDTQKQRFVQALESLPFSASNDTQHASERRSDAILPIGSTLEMYLPVLWEDPSRASAWRIGATFRHSAETLVLFYANVYARIVEYRKAGNGVEVGNLRTLFGVTLPHRFSVWIRFFNDHDRLDIQLHAAVRWRWLVMQLVLKDMVDEDMTLPTSELIVDVLTGASATTWSMVHLRAQFEAEYYSVRMLSQIMSCLISASPSIIWMRQLYKQIVDLPPIAEFFDREVAEGIDRQQWNGLVEKVLLSMGVRDGGQQTRPETKRKAGPTSGDKEQRRPARGANLFHALKEE